jgi:hypothetical protein
LLVGRENLVGRNEVGDSEDGVGIADCENFFLISYIDRGTVSSHSANFVIDIVTAETASTY